MKCPIYASDGSYLATASKMTDEEIAEQRRMQEKTVANWFKSLKVGDAR